MARMHWNVKNLTGQKFGLLTVIGFAGSIAHKSHWLCRCDCGNNKTVKGIYLTDGATKSCGCNRFAGHRRTHGKSHTRAFNIWLGMKQRCENPKNPAYRLYGGRGIAICARWQKFENFFADMGPAPNGLSIDRKDNDKGYDRSNCRWATPLQQSRNRRGVKHG